MNNLKHMKIGDTVYITDNSYAHLIGTGQFVNTYFAGTRVPYKPQVKLILRSEPYKVLLCPPGMSFVRAYEFIDVEHEGKLYRVLNTASLKPRDNIESIILR